MRKKIATRFLPKQIMFLTPKTPIPSYPIPLPKSPGHALLIIKSVGQIWYLLSSNDVAK